MAALIKFSLFVIALIAIVNAQRIVDVPDNIPPNMPWIPSWVECEFDFGSDEHGPKCNDCFSILHCTPKGGILRNCFGWRPYCVEGKCVEEPSADCGEVETVTDMY